MMAADRSDQTTVDREIDVAMEIGDGWTRKLTITVPPERVGRARAVERQRLAKTVRIKGFRRGKIPADIIEQRYGSFLDEHVRGALVEQAYREAVDETELRPAGAAQITNVQYAPGERLTFQAEFEIMPSVKLDRVGGFKVEKNVEPVTEDEFNRIIDNIRSEHADWRGVDRAPADGDRVSVAIEPMADGEGEPQGKARPYQFVLGSGQALEDVERAIRELAPGGEGTFEVSFASEGGTEDAEVRRLHIRLEGVEEQILPELDDDLAQKVGDFESREALEQAVREDLDRHHEEEAEGRLRGKLLEAVIDANPFSLPRALVDRYLDGMIEVPEGADQERVREARAELAPLAERQLKEQLILDHLVERQGFKATEDEISSEIERLAERRGVQAPDLRRRLARENALETLGRNLAVEKVFAYLKKESGVG